VRSSRRSASAGRRR